MSTELTDEQAGFARRCVRDWLNIRGNEGDSQLACDADHSSLLYRLLCGGEKFDEAPPLVFSYPAYSFCEGKVVRCEAFFYRDFGTPGETRQVAPDEVIVGDDVNLNQGIWRVVEICGEGSFQVRWRDSGWLGGLWKVGDEHFPWRLERR